jgi:hypothetical protein
MSLEQNHRSPQLSLFHDQPIQFCLQIIKQTIPELTNGPEFPFYMLVLRSKKEKNDTDLNTNEDYLD